MNIVSKDEAGAIFFSKHSNITFDRNIKIHFTNNSAHMCGGAVRLYSYSSISFGGSSVITFTDNEAAYGGTISCDKISVSFKGESMVTF